MIPIVRSPDIAAIDRFVYFSAAVNDDESLWSIERSEGSRLVIDVKERNAGKEKASGK